MTPPRPPPSHGETIRDVPFTTLCETIRDALGRTPLGHGEGTLRYPCAQSGEMFSSRSVLRHLRYQPPKPPRPDTLATNRPRVNPPRLVWDLPIEARIRLADPTAPHSAVVAIWSCPVCATPVPRWRRAGRHRVYCTNACRQRAYRQRCVTRAARPMPLRRDPRPLRATTRDRVHAVREYRDVLSGRRDSQTRGVTACGAFARIAADTPERFGHVRFLATRNPRNTTTCRRCQQLSGSLDDAPILSRCDP